MLTKAAPLIAILNATEPPTVKDDDFDYPVRPCVGSGQCCKTAPCPFGEADPNDGSCIYLERWKGDDLEGVERYRCGRYEHIVKQPSSYWSPAFGAGCCQTLFNRNRERILDALERRRLNIVP